MDNNKIQLIGAPCGHHGPYTFYKGFKYKKNGRHKILALSDFFFVKLWSDSDLISIGELQLLWQDKNNEQVLSSLRLYFLPENTPEGRNDDHGEDEVLAISEKVVLRVEDLLDRIIENADWCRGLEAVWEKDCLFQTSEEDAKSHGKMLIDSVLDFQDVLKEKEEIAEESDAERSAVVVLSFPRYCRYRGIVKRLEGVANKWLKNALVIALGGFAVPSRHTRILFCKDTFDYPDLEGHELLCNHLAPNLKGRPRRKRKKRSVSPGDSESNESEESQQSTVSSTVKSKLPGSGTPIKNGLRCNSLQPRRSGRVTASPQEKEFLVKLHRFMKLRQTPIGRVPHLGFKEIDLYAFFNKVQKLGGYNVVTANRMWKPIYDDLGGHQGSTSAATCTRRHYERLLLPYERSVKNDHAKERGRPRSIKYESDKGDVKLPTCTITSASDMKSKEKTASLRSVRTKPDKNREDPSGTQRPKDKENIPVSNLSEGLVVEVKLESSSEGGSDIKPLPELIDLASSDQDSTAKTLKTSTVPALKKRKLEILKEGGLEVTAITPAMAPTTSIGSVTIMPDRRPSVIQHASPVQGQVSITVTPDVSHMLGSSPTESNSANSTPSPTAGYDAANTHRSPVSVHDLKHPALQHLFTGSLSQANNSSTPSPSSDEWTPPRVTQSRSIYARSETVVYGNPKDLYGNHKEIYGQKQMYSVQKDLYAKQKEAYGNPKEAAELPPGLLYRRRSYVKPTPSGGEVLDLRINSPRKPAVSISRVTSSVPQNTSARNPVRSNQKTNGVAPFPIIDGRAMVGSNLEITVVDVPRSPTLQQRQQQQQQLMQQNKTFQQHQQQQRQRSVSISRTSTPTSRPMSRNENGRHSSLSITHVPPRSTSQGSNSSQLVIPNPFMTSSKNSSGDSSRSRQHHSNPNSVSSHSGTSTSSSMPYLPTGSPVFPGYLPHLSPASSGSSGGSTSSKNTSPYPLPLLDPMYYSALYNSGHGLYPPNVAAAAAAFLSPLQMAAAPPLFTPSAEHLQLYKDLMQHSSMRFNQSSGGLLGLPRDGSTSITPIGHSTPTTK